MERLKGYTPAVARNGDRYNLGDQVLLDHTFTSLDDGSAADPSTTLLKVRDPEGTVATYTYPGQLDKDATGTFHYHLDVPLSGHWWYRWEGDSVTPGVVDAYEGSFYVRVSAIV